MKTNNGISKTTAGAMLLGGILLAIVASIFATDGQIFGSDAGSDTLNDLVSYASGLVALVGVGMFFYGAMIFSRG